MENLTEIVESITLLSKKVDKLLNLNTKIAKSLHLIPVTEKEEREIQLLQRTNLQIAAKVNEELSAMQPVEPDFTQLTIGALEVPNVFSDVLGDDYIPKE